MLGVVATLKIKEGTNTEFEAAAGRLIAAVTSSEPGCLLYALHRTDDPNCYVFMERYTDEEALANHGKSDDFRAIGAEMGAFMDGRPEIMRLQQVDWD